ncbi:MAG: DUF6314 family protein [Marmoricola sp.]
MPTSLDPRLLLGRWRLDRVIDDTRGRERSTVTGVLDLLEEGPDAIRWEEQGHWCRTDAAVEVRRRLRLALLPSGWWVHFEDGRPFHAWTPGTPVVHPCGADTYRGLVTGDVTSWRVRWDVEGPAKDYSMTSILTPGP